MKHLPSLRHAFLSLLLAGLPLHPPGLRAAPPAAAEGRETIEFEGIRIVFPKGEADVVEHLKPALRKFREERQKAVAAEAREIGDCLSDAEWPDKFSGMISGFLARKTLSDQFDARWTLQALTMQKLADAWSAWSGDISELHLWGAGELAPFQSRSDGKHDREGLRYKFPDVAFEENGKQIELQVPFLVPLFGVDMMLKLARQTKGIRVDIPLLYKPGASPEMIAEFGRGFIEHLSTQLHAEYSKGLGLPKALPHWVIENLVLGEMEAVFVERRTAEETALADGLARLTLFVYFFIKDGEAATFKNISRLFPFGMNGWDISDPAASLAILETLDPLAKVERAKVTERIFSRNLIALALFDVAQRDAAGSPILLKLKKESVDIPEGGFTMETFIAAVDAAYKDKGLFQRAVAERKANTLEQLRASAAKIQEKKTASPPPEVKQPAAPAGMPGRLTAKFDGLTITFPPELKAAVEIIGPEYAKVIAKARAAMEMYCKEHPPKALEVTDADLAALRAYGIEPDTRVLRYFGVVLGALRGGSQLARWFTYGDRMQIWTKEDMRVFLKGGGVVQDFSLSPDEEFVVWSFGIRVSDTLPEAGKPMASDADALAEAVRLIDAAPRPVYPIVLKPGELPEKLDDPSAVAAAIRKAEGILDLLRKSAENPESLSDEIGSILPKSNSGHERGWFIVAHEAAEFGIVSDTIKSADRRWFCDGMANWIAIREVDRRHGAGEGAKAFANLYNAAELRKEAPKVDLLAWPTAEDVDNGTRPDVENSSAHYYFATLVIEKACEGRGADFVKSWLDEIRKTPLNRANSGTVFAAYRKLAGKDLKGIIAEVVK